MLRRFTAKPIQVKDIAEIHPTYLGAGGERKNWIEIYLNSNISTSVQEVVFIHELTHIIMRNQGFPGIAMRADVAGRFNPIQKNDFIDYRNLFSSTIDHLRIYATMQKEYSLDFDSYFRLQIEAKTRKLQKFPDRESSKNDEYFHSVQQLILDGLEYPFYPEPFKQEIMTLFKSTTTQGFMASSALFSKVSKIGFETPQELFKCAVLIQNQIVHYGEKKSVGPVNQLYSGLVVVRDARDIPLPD